MSNKKQKKPFFIIFNIEASTDLIDNNLTELENLKTLNKILNEGNTTLLLKEATKNNGNMLQFFGFQNTFRNDQYYENIKDEEIILDQNKYYLDIENCKPVPENLNQEDIAEMYQEKIPTNLSQISNAARCMLITNNKKTCKFAHQIEINNRFISSLEKLNVLQEINYYQEKFFNLLIFDIFAQEKKQLIQELIAIEKIFDELDPSHYVSLLISPFATKYNIDQIFKSFKEQIEANPLKDAINSIIPRQTYEFLYWEENKEFLQREKDLILMIQYSKDYCRQDKITSFAMLNDLKNFNLIGNKFINFELLWRELKFKMGKLPKFGA